ncbi:hypothetical protein BJX96DRAFT_140397 [Aspergillus floccosus]
MVHHTHDHNCLFPTPNRLPGVDGDMRLLGSSLAFATVAAAQSSTLIAAPSVSSTPQASEACAKASRLYEQDPSIPIPAKYAYDCLKSVPVAVADDKDLIEQLKLYWALHSETGYLKNPPKTWDLGPLDLIGELDKIKEKIGSYESEFDVQQAIRELTIRTGNFHFNYVPDILQVFIFMRTVQIASISDDGTATPKAYVWEDLALQDIDDSVDISAITKVNGEDVQDYLSKMAAREQYIDGDARYNSLMATHSSYGSFHTPNGYNAYEGPTTTLTFENGTQRTWTNIAYVQKPLEGVTDGESFFVTFCTGQFASLDAYLSQKSGAHAWSKRQIPSSRYPDPIVQDQSGKLAGYFLNGAGNDDLAVLKIISFDVSGPNATDWQRTVRQFLQKSKNAGKKKLVIDLRENGGGSTQLLLDTFMQLFPGDVPFSAQRYRAHENFKLIGDAINAMHSDDSIRTDIAAVGDAVAMFRYWSYWNFVDVDGENFDSWSEFYGPHLYNGDNFTTNMRYNMSNSNRNSILEAQFNFLNPTGEPVFTAENTVMLTDGLCGSACASFHEELKNIAGVQAVAVGGRPQDGPMQTVGGSKGGEVPSHIALAVSIQMVVNITQAYDLAGYDGLETLANPHPLLTRAGDDQSRIQLQDQIRKGDESGAALQYIYEAADCRLYYTTKTLFHPEAMWEAAWSAYQDTSKCVNGSTDQPSSISGGYKPFGPGDLNGKMEQKSETSGASTMLSPSVAAVAVAGLMGFLL